MIKLLIFLPCVWSTILNLPIVKLSVFMTKSTNWLHTHIIIYSDVDRIPRRQDGAVTFCWCCHTVCIPESNLRSWGTLLSVSYLEFKFEGFWNITICHKTLLPILLRLQWGYCTELNCDIKTILKRIYW